MVTTISKMDIQTTINEWIAAGNSFDAAKYLDFYADDAVLDDPSVGRVYKGREEIKQYFNSYFIGYKTQTKLVSVESGEQDHFHVEVKFTGDFPEGNIGGIFDLTFKDGKIAFVKADLLH